MACVTNGIEHRMAKPNHLWVNGKVERYHFDNHDQLRGNLADFLNAHNYASRLKALDGLTPYEHICKIWISEPDRFILNPIHQIPGLNTWSTTWQHLRSLRQR